MGSEVLPMGRRLAWTAGILLVLAAGAAAVVGADPARLRTRASIRDQPPLRPDEILVEVDGPDGLPVPRGWLRHPDMHVAANGGGGGGSWRTFGNGRQRVEFDRESADPALQGQRWLEFWGALDAAGRPLPFGAILVGPLDPAKRLVTIALPREVPFEGGITRSGSPVPGVTVKARLSFPGAMAWQGWGSDVPSHAEGTSGPDGRFLLGGLSKGPLTVRFSAPPGIALAETTGESGIPLRIDLGAAPWSGVTVTVQGGLPGFEVRVIEGRKGPFSSDIGSMMSDVVVAAGRTGADGKIRIHGLAPDGNYALEIGPDRHRVFRPGREIPRWKPADTTLPAAGR
jgi:hypothetical protein